MDTSRDFRCPKCQSSDVHHRVTAQNPFRCGRCGAQWGGSDRPKEPGWLSKTIKWCVKHPRETGIIILVLVTLGQIGVITGAEGEDVSTGQLVFAWIWMISTIISVVIWLALKINRRGKKRLDGNVNPDEIGRFK